VCAVLVEQSHDLRLFAASCSSNRAKSVINSLASSSRILSGAVLARNPRIAAAAFLGVTDVGTPPAISSRNKA
jgi:hypothetical protein